MQTSKKQFFLDNHKMVQIGCSKFLGLLFKVFLWIDKNHYALNSAIHPSSNQLTLHRKTQSVVRTKKDEDTA